MVNPIQLYNFVIHVFIFCCCIKTLYNLYHYVYNVVNYLICIIKYNKIDSVVSLLWGHPLYNENVAFQEGWSPLLSKSSDPFPYSKQYYMLCVSPLSFHIEILLNQHSQYALDTSRTLFLLASTQGVSCRLVMNHLIYVYVLSHYYFLVVERGKAMPPSCNNVAPVTNLCLSRATTRSHSSQWSKKKSCSWNIKTHYLHFKHFIITIIT
jgi:hypothetical protein